MKKYMYIIIGILVIIPMIGCYPMGMLFGKILSGMGNKVEYIACKVKSDKYYHCYLLVNNRIFEPRFLGTFKIYTVLYNDIVMQSESADEFSYWAENMMFG